MIIGNKIFRYPIIDSTNNEAKRLIVSGQALEGTVIVADEQTSGRGKPGSSWFSPARVGLYFSAVVKPYKNPADLTRLTLVAAAAVVETIKELTSLTAAIKQPNDVLLDGKKVCGILCEKLTSGFVIIGIGLNVSHEAVDFPKELAAQATSLHLAVGQTFVVSEVQQTLTKVLDRHYLAYLQEIC